MQTFRKSSEPIGMFAAVQLIRPCFLMPKYHDLFNNLETNTIQTCKCLPTLFFENTFVFCGEFFLFVLSGFLWTNLSKLINSYQTISNSTCLFIIVFAMFCHFLPF